jgi:L-threonylcarbamoyladenylate synthase
VGVLETEEQICYYSEADILRSLGPESDPEAHAQALFGALREFDAAGVDVIFARALKAEGVDDAVMNRMFRAAGGTVLPAEE